MCREVKMICPMGQNKLCQGMARGLATTTCPFSRPPELNCLNRNVFTTLQNLKTLKSIGIPQITLNLLKTCISIHS